MFFRDLFMSASHIGLCEGNIAGENVQYFASLYGVLYSVLYSAQYSVELSVSNNL